MNVHDLLARLSRVQPAGTLKWQALCPAHDDRHPSLSVGEGEDGRVLLKCFAGCSAESIVAGMGLSMRDLMQDGIPRPTLRQVTSKATHRVQADRRPSTAPPFEPADAVRIWALARSRARDDDAVEEHRPVYEYLAKRGLMPAWELAGFGILHDQEGLPAAIQSWARRKYQLVAPLYDSAGIVKNIQARGLPPCDPKTLVPAGSRLVGTAFADSRGRSLLADEIDAEFVVFGEGLTDMLALAIASPFPVITSPGTSNAVAACGPWAAGRRILLALDNDVAGDRAVHPVSAELYRYGAESVLRVRWPSGAKDVCDVLERHGAEQLGDFLRREPTARVA